MKKVSIIIPTFNSSRYLSNCLDSVCNQSYNNLEIIIVDDGSNDSTYQIIKEYEQKDCRIKSYFTQHKGPGNARNIGLDNSTGYYISFIDSDDTVNKKFIEELVLLIKPKDLFSQCAGKMIFPNGEKYDSFVANKEEIKCFKIPILFNKLFNKSEIDKHKIRFKNVKYGEDIDFWGRLMIKNDNISVSSKCLYYYHFRKNSLTQSYQDKEDIYIIMKILDGILELSKKTGYYYLHKERLEFLFIKEIFIRALKQLSYFENFSDVDIKKLVVFVENNFPNWFNNKYINKYFDQTRIVRLMMIKKREYDKLKEYLKDMNKGGETLCQLKK